MDPAAVLALLSNLYAQLAQANERIAELQAALEAPKTES